MEFNATIGDPEANSYITVEEADDILESRVGVGTDWSDLSDAEKEAALISATLRLEQEEYESFAFTTTQGLQFPRERFRNTFSNGWYENDEIPKGVQYATAELALQLVRNPELLDDTGLEPFSTFSKGDLTLTMRGHAAGKLPAQVARHLRGIRTGGANVIRLQRA
jgi:hypothetical protein